MYSLVYECLGDTPALVTKSVGGILTKSKLFLVMKLGNLTLRQVLAHQRDSSSAIVQKITMIWHSMMSLSLRWELTPGPRKGKVPTPYKEWLVVAP
jgi:hypothetical protein